MECKLQTNSAIALQDHGNSQGVEYINNHGTKQKTNPLICCSKKFGNYLVTTLGYDDLYQTKHLRNWVSFFMELK